MLLPLLLLGALTALLLDPGVRFCYHCDHFDGFRCRGGMKSCWTAARWVRFCYHCDHFDGFRCRGGMKSCWKLNMLWYLYRYTTLGCQPCVEGMFQVFHDLLRETTCCTNLNKCNDANRNPDITRIFGKETKDETVYSAED
ncbi:hypothetical protein TREES_T100008316 [Tupaia chinensis]|uniref:Uncharacterized protein n=1 Tax=Tupaia chinensis TaxID=246437 RepID=L9LBB3_TUPCH|nr:hypothetical protein TREES_T100008316 [Tupaia chinensis]